LFIDSLICILQWRHLGGGAGKGIAPPLISNGLVKFSVPWGKGPMELRYCVICPTLRNTEMTPLAYYKGILLREYRSNPTRIAVILVSNPRKRNNAWLLSLRSNYTWQSIYTIYHNIACSQTPLVSVPGALVMRIYIILNIYECTRTV